MKVRDIVINGVDVRIAITGKSGGHNYSAKAKDTGRELAGGWFNGNARDTFESVERDLRERSVAKV